MILAHLFVTLGLFHTGIINADPVRFNEDIVNNVRVSVSSANVRPSRSFNFPSETKAPIINNINPPKPQNNPVRSPKILADPVIEVSSPLSNHLNSQTNLQKSSKSESEMLTVIERLSERLGIMEQRLSSLENVMEQMQKEPLRTAGSSSAVLQQQQQQQQVRSCPANFISLPDSPVDSPCYYFSSSILNRRHNWQDAAQSCQKLGAKLVEPETAVELSRIENYLSTLPDYRGSNYWTGGINPGLLWIWSVAAKPLQNFDSAYWLESSDSETDKQDDNGKCLRIAFDRNEQRYGLQGADCQRYLYFVCQHSEADTKSRNVPLSSTVEPEVVTSNFKAVLGFRLATNNQSEPADTYRKF